MALDHSVHRDIIAPGPPSEVYLAAEGEQFYQGSIVGIDTADGLLKVATASTTLNILGTSCAERDTTDLDADERWIPVEHGTIGWFDSAADADLIAADDITKDCYAADDATVALTNGGSTRSRAGMIKDVDDEGRIAVQFEVVR
jgi:hypothetical protein